MVTGLRVLIVDDEPNIRRTLAIGLRARGYLVESTGDGAGALRRAAECHPDLVVLDLGLPDMDGSEVIGKLRGWTSIPVLVLSARVGSQDKVRALDAGADDYVTKPFDVAELLARLRALARRTGAEVPAVVDVGALRVDLELRTVRDVAGATVTHLTPTEWQILEVLALAPGRLLTHDAILRAIGRDPAFTDDSYLRLYVGQLRRKLEVDHTRPRFLLTEPGLGYRFVP